jgi:branched-chain amino acid transport system ATP-binding protein
LLARPVLMMLDEPSLGLSPILVNQLFDLIVALNKDGLSILLVEQNTHKALQTANRGYVLELGKVVAKGTPDQLRSGEKLEAAYLGAG